MPISHFVGWLESVIIACLIASTRLISSPWRLVTSIILSARSCRPGASSGASAWSERRPETGVRIAIQSLTECLTLTLGPNVNLLLTPDLNVVQMRTIVIVVIVVKIVCRQLRTGHSKS